MVRKIFFIIRPASNLMEAEETTCQEGHRAFLDSEGNTWCVGCGDAFAVIECDQDHPPTLIVNALV